MRYAIRLAEIACLYKWTLADCLEAAYNEIKTIRDDVWQILWKEINYAVVSRVISGAANNEDTFVSESNGIKGGCGTVNGDAIKQTLNEEAIITFGDAGKDGLDVQRSFSNA